MACNSCHLNFRYPRIPQNVLDRLYREGSPDVWQYDESKRIDWQNAWREVESEAKPAAILDIGCFDGAFLAKLERGWHRYGVEPNPVAAERAGSRGIEILGETLATVDRLQIPSLDVITAFDLLEHLPDPMFVVAFASDTLHTGGRLIIASGDTDAWSWRFMGSQYWYSAIPEHLSFINEPWIRHAAAQHSMELVRLERYSHQPTATTTQRAYELATNLVHRVSPRITGMLRSAGFGGLDVRSHQTLKQFPPQWMSARDHILAVLQK